MSAVKHESDGPTPPTEAELREMLVMGAVEFCKGLSVEVDEGALRHFANVFERTVERGVNEAGMEWWNDVGEEYAMGRFRRLGRELSRYVEGTTDEPASARDLEEALWIVTEQTQEAMERLRERRPDLARRIGEWHERLDPDGDWPFDTAICPYERFPF